MSLFSGDRGCTVIMKTPETCYILKILRKYALTFTLFGAFEAIAVFVIRLG